MGTRYDAGNYACFNKSLQKDVTSLHQQWSYVSSAMTYWFWINCPATPAVDSSKTAWENRPIITAINSWFPGLRTLHFGHFIACCPASSLVTLPMKIIWHQDGSLVSVWTCIYVTMSSPTDYDMHSWLIINWYSMSEVTENFFINVDTACYEGTGITDKWILEMLRQKLSLMLMA